jgi:hypothetical protein
MSETHTRDTASPFAGRARPRCGTRSPVPRCALPVVTPRPRTELLVLTKHELGRRTAELFTALDSDPGLRDRFVHDPMGVVAERVHEHRVDAQTASEVSRFIVAMLADDGFMTWYRDHRKACSDVDEHELVRAFTNALVDHAEESLLVSLVEGATARVGRRRSDHATSTPESQPSSSPQGNGSTNNTSSRELYERVMSPALLRAIAEDLLAVPAAIAR